MARMRSALFISLTFTKELACLVTPHDIQGCARSLCTSIEVMEQHPEVPLPVLRRSDIPFDHPDCCSYFLVARDKPFKATDTTLAMSSEAVILATPQGLQPSGGLTQV